MRRAVLSPEQQEARAKNAVADFLFRQLIVPKVFSMHLGPTEAVGLMFWPLIVRAVERFTSLRLR